MLGRLLLFAILFIGLDLPAHLIYQDDFAYPDGPLLSASGSPWLSHLTPSNEINVVSGQLFLTQTEQESVRYTFSNTYTQGSLSASFQIRVTTLPTGNGNYFAFFRATTWTYFCRLWISTNGVAEGKYRLGITTTANQPYEMIPVDLALGETHTLVMRLTVDGGLYTSTLWIDPMLETDSARRAENTEYIGVGFFLAHFAFKQVSLYEPPGGMGDLFVDDLRLGRSFNDVMPLRFTSLSNLGAGGIKLLGAGLAGTNYSIFANTNLNTTNWFKLGSATANAGGVIDFTDTGATNRPACYYRLAKP